MSVVNFDDLKEMEEELSRQLQEKETGESDLIKESLLDILFSEELESPSAEVEAISFIPSEFWENDMNNQRV